MKQQVHRLCGGMDLECSRRDSKLVRPRHRVGEGTWKEMTEVILGQFLQGLEIMVRRGMYPNMMGGHGCVKTEKGHDPVHIFKISIPRHFSSAGREHGGLTQGVNSRRV